MGEFISNLSPRTKTLLLPAGLAVLGILFLGYGLIHTSSSSTPDQAVTFSKAKAETQIASNDIKADIEGAVNSPGVYGLSTGARIEDLLKKAGGLNSNADSTWVAKHLNLALKLTDGAKVYVPQVGEQGESGSTASTGDVAGAATAQININNATADELDSLPGVGKVTADKIVGGRDYGSIDDLVNKKIVSQNVFNKIKDKITVY